MLLRLLRIGLAVVICGLPLFSDTVVYVNDFSGAIGSELGVSPGTLSTVSPFGGCSSLTYCTNFLGLLYGGSTPEPLDNHTVTLSLTGLPGHTSASVSLALFLFRTWDGNDGSFGPDHWALAVAGGETLLDTTFANENKLQSYPGNYPASNPPRTGAAENNSLGLSSSSVYLFSYTFPHTASSLSLTFQGSNLQGWHAGSLGNDEGWGIDNLRVGVTESTGGDVPEPGSLSLAGTVLAAMAVALRRRFPR